ncbi:MAG: DUF2723 domain-containing protein, partial [candidate division Zixibacteria bacterium]|nr:DUF2723 domain-containing protein [candidate division Zixibacteria bacterium]
MNERTQRLIPPVVGGAALLVYCLTCCRTVYVGDSGELTLALSTGGIAHPPGYPLYSILGYLWLKLFFFLTPVLAANLLSAAVTAAAVVILYLILRRTAAGRVSPWINAAVALSFAFSRSIWGSATNAEVYGLAALVYLMALYIVIRYYEGDNPSGLIPAAFFCGLTLTHHFSAGVVGAALLVVMYLRRKELSSRLIIAAIGAFLLPMTLYLYLPARFDPMLPVNWMTAKSAAGLWGMITADIYQQFVGLPTLGDIGLYLLRLGGLLAAAFGPGLLLLALPGAADVVRKKSSLALIVTLPAVFNIIMVSIYRIPDFEGYLIPLVVAAVFLLRESAALIPQRLYAHRWLPGAIAGFLIVFPVGFNFSTCDISGFRLAERFGRDLLDSAPEKTLVFLKSDNGSHTALYLRYLEGYRPDLEVYSTNSTLARLEARFAGDDYSWIVDSLDYMTNRVYRGAEYIINQGVPPGYPDRELVGFLYGLVAAETDQARLINRRISEFIRDSLDRIDLNDD